ncbi:hypothetical protein HN011_003429 [Eciton burchellii]|nr:hypothetical protein HN011_003429 [Eciton burchellii]
MKTRVAVSAIALLIVLVNGQKIGPLLYRKCKIQQDCLFEGGFCNYAIKQCDCIKDYIPSSNGQRCVPVLASFDATCTDENQCLSLLANSTCFDNKCVCAPDYHYVNNTCWRKVEYGYACTGNQDCSHIEGAICTDNRKCECEAKTVLSADGTRCLAVAKAIQDKCVETAQCTMTFEYTICVDNVCQCEPNYHYENDVTRCFPNKALDDDCVDDYDCYQAEDYINNSSIKSLKCEANKCTCADYYIRYNEGCINSGSSLAVSLSVIVSAIALACSVLFS